MQSLIDHLATTFVAIISVLMAAGNSSAIGPSTPYYLADGGLNSLQVVRSGAIVDRWITKERLYPLAVASTIKAYQINGYYSAIYGDGIEYTLEGSPTGRVFPWQDGPQLELLDGGTDAESHNYAIEWNAVWSFDLNWQNPVLLFRPQAGADGITYDRKASSLWISLYEGNIQQVTLSGSVLNQFDPGPGRWGALAWEPATDTLWAHKVGSSILRQWSKTGVLLEEVSINYAISIGRLGVTTFGGEFSVVPEPASIALATIAFLAMNVRRRC